MPGLFALLFHVNHATRGKSAGDNDGAGGGGPSQSRRKAAQMSSHRALKVGALRWMRELPAAVHPKGLRIEATDPRAGAATKGF